MDLSFSLQEQAFRKEIRKFIDAELPHDIRDKMRLGYNPNKEDVVRWHRILNKRGWATPAWPVEFGGPGWNATQCAIFLEEIFQAPAPEPMNFNSNMVGPLIIQFGTPNQKKRFLPAIANLDLWFCIGMSEPNSGSDLASLRTAAVRDGNDYIVTGQKIWTSTAHLADWIYCLVRTSSSGRKQQGISILLIDLKSPGITIRPIISLDRRHHFNEVFFDNVRVPIENRIGEENQGWACAKYLTGRERTGIARVGLSKEKLDFARRLLQDPKHSPMINDGARRAYIRRMAEINAELKALEMAQFRVLSIEANSADGAPVELASFLKVVGSEILQSTGTLALDIAGIEAVEATVSWGPADTKTSMSKGAVGSVTSTYAYGRAASIYGGTNEVQRNIIAGRLLGAE